MAEDVKEEQPMAHAPVTPTWRSFLEMGFRPLYLAGCFWAAVSVALWVFAPALLRGTLAGVVWHAHEMLWGFIATIAVGFLLTASATWTGTNPAQGSSLGSLTLLWIAARIGYLIPGATAFAVAAMCELLFFSGAAWALGCAIYGARSRRNYGVPLLVLLLGVADAMFLLAVHSGDYLALMQRFQTGLVVMALIALLVGGRVIPFFAMRGVPGLTIPMLTRLGRCQLAAGTLAVACELSGWHSTAALLLTFIGAVALFQLVAWKPHAVLRMPLLWILYVGYGALGIGLLAAAAQLGGMVTRVAWPAHLIGVAGLSVLIIGMVTRTALGHLGRPLRADPLIVCCYSLTLAAAAFRLLALLPTGLALGALHASAGMWCLAFTLYLWRFAPILIGPRMPSVSALVQGLQQLPAATAHRPD